MKRKRKLKLEYDVPHEESKFTLQFMYETQRAMQAGEVTYPRDRIQISDDIVPGLRAMVYKMGTISATISYWINRERFMFRVGDLNKDSVDYTTLDIARTRAKAIKQLADRGINIQEGLHQRVWAELDRDGDRWRPMLTPALRR